MSGEGGKVEWDPSSARFGPGVVIVGAPIDPRTQRIVPTAGVTEEVEVWVAFVLEGPDVNALDFCQEACQKTRRLVEEMAQAFSL